ncbi:C-type lectin domain family 4 member E-like [Epinephelus lanceolatus]
MEEIYANVENAKPVNPRPSTAQTTGTRSSERFPGAVVPCLGLLNVLLLAGLTGLGVYCKSAFFIQVNVKKICPAEWRMFSCVCYFLSTRSDSWEKGRQDCRDRGADLVVINTLEEQEFITQIIRSNTWIGLNDRDKEGTWMWTDGTPLTVAYWRGWPDNWREEDCVEILAGKKTRENWNDLRCDTSKPWICEKMP